MFAVGCLIFTVAFVAVSKFLANLVQKTQSFLLAVLFIALNMACVAATTYLCVVFFSYAYSIIGVKGFMIASSVSWLIYAINSANKRLKHMRNTKASRKARSGKKY